MILPLKKQVPTRKTCERLQKTGFPYETLYYHVNFIDSDEWYVLSDWEMALRMSAVNNYFPAPTAAELGALLRAAWLNGGEEVVDLIPDEMSNAWMGGENEAEARALLWLDLHGKGLLPDAAYGASSH